MYHEIIVLGVLVSLIFTEITGLSAGLVVPGYLALSLHSPLRLEFISCVPPNMIPIPNMWMYRR